MNQTEDVTLATGKWQETENISGLTLIDEVLNKILAEHVKQPGASGN